MIKPSISEYFNYLQQFWVGKSQFCHDCLSRINNNPLSWKSNPSFTLCKLTITKVSNYSESSDMKSKLFVAELLQSSHNTTTLYKRDYSSIRLSFSPTSKCQMNKEKVISFFIFSHLSYFHTHPTLQYLSHIIWSNLSK